VPFDLLRPQLAAALPAPGAQRRLHLDEFRLATAPEEGVRLPTVLGRDGKPGDAEVFALLAKFGMVPIDAASSHW
jgi:hypothetical protein